MRSVETRESSQTLHGTAAEKDQHTVSQEGEAHEPGGEVHGGRDPAGGQGAHRDDK